MTVNYDDAPVPVRADLVESHRRAWQRLARPGTWLSGAERVAIAAETRNAPSCALCTERRQALSPYSITGTHDGLGKLSGAALEVVHRIVTDSGRLRRQWYLDALESGMADTKFVETVGVVVTTVALDTFCRALSVPPHPLPQPEPGKPSRTRPAGAADGLAWVPTVPPEDAVDEVAVVYKDGASNIRRALTLVPAEAGGFFDLVNHQYQTAAQMRDFSTEYRAITHAQIELVAGRISALNQCLY